jgi:hypothetical protein
MAIVSNPLIGAAKQKMGGAVFTTWKGKNVLKTKPLSVANPRTDLQLMRRSAMTQVVAIGRLLLSMINIGFKSLATGKSEFNVFTSVNLKDAFNYASPPTATFTASGFSIAKGTIATQLMDTIVGDVSLGTVVLTWTYAAGPAGQSSNDVLLAVIYNATQDRWDSYVTTETRDNETYTITPPVAMVAGNVLNIYTAFKAATGSNVSDSVWQTTTVIA